mgnify:CR=1 FL=1
MVKKPKIFENKIDKDIRNNKSVFDSSKEEVRIIKKEELIKDNNDISVVDKITRLLNRNGYIFNVKVLIKTKDTEYNTHIASVINNHIITLDNDIINIDDVIDIVY